MKRVRKEYDGDEPEMLITNVFNEDGIDKKERAMWEMGAVMSRPN